MEQLVYLSWRRPARVEAYRERLLGAVAPRRLDAGVRKLDLYVSDLLGKIPKPMLLLAEGGTLSAVIER